MRVLARLWAYVCVGLRVWCMRVYVCVWVPVCVCLFWRECVCVCVCVFLC